MFIQDQLPAEQINGENLSFFKAIGVDYLTINPPPLAASGHGTGPLLEEPGEIRDYFLETCELAEAHGLKLMNIALTGPDEITLALPERDRKIEQWCEVLQAMGEVGIPTLGYNFKPIGNFRTASTYGRGGARYSTFVYEEFSRNVPSHPDKQIDEPRMWENLRYFLERVVPVAAEAGVRLALHPDDPPIPEPMAGAARIVSTLDQYRRIFELAPSPANAMLFCQGCVTEMGVDVLQAIRDIGGLGKIVYVHFRNVRGSRRSFQEVFVDEGDVDMYAAMQTYKESGFEGPFMMDHTPGIPEDRAGRAGHAFATGYIRAMIQSVYR
jgi:mannonate dehydratase